MSKGSPKQKKVFKSLSNFYYAAGESISLNMKVYVKDKVVDGLEEFDNVDVELIMTSDERCGIMIYCEDEKYEQLGMQTSYSVKTAKFKFENVKDYQSTYKALEIYPNNTKDKFIILNVKEINKIHVSHEY